MPITVPRRFFATAAAAAFWNQAYAAHHTALRAPGVEDSVVKPMSVHQTLLVCNAYPNESPLEAIVADQKGPSNDIIPFGDCQNVGARVKTGDRLDLSLHGASIKGTFEVGALPQADAQLLVVPYKRKGSPLIHFQSFAFPIHADGKNAQLALFDTFAGNTTDMQLRIKSHAAPQKIPETMDFDRVFSVASGVYEVGDAEEVVNFAKDQNYVVIRTGDDQGSYPQSLIVFPKSPMPPPPPKVVAVPTQQPTQSFLSRLLKRVFG